MGLYALYQPLGNDVPGNWFAATTAGGRLLGLATARLIEPRACQVDGFTHENHSDAWESLVATAVSWAADMPCESCRMRVSSEDQAKLMKCEELGFRNSGIAAPFELTQRQVPSWRLDLAL